MANDTKACNLTEDEIKTLIGDHGRNVIEYDANNMTLVEDRIERISYLTKRLKAFKEEATAVKQEPTAQPNNQTEQAKVTDINQGWGQTNG